MARRLRDADPQKQNIYQPGDFVLQELVRLEPHNKVGPPYTGLWKVDDQNLMM